MLAITSCCFMMSCANNQSTDEGAQLDGAEQTLSDTGGDQGGGDQAATDLSDLDAAAGAPADASAPPPDGADTAPPADAQASAGGSEDLEKAMAGNGQPDAGTPPPDAGAPPPDAGAPPSDLQANAAPPPDAGAPPPDAGAPPPDASAPPPDLQANNAPPPDAGAGGLPPDAGAGGLPPDAGAAAVGAGVPGSELAPPDAPAEKKHVAHGPASAPKVKQAPFKKGTTTLNRFYFARKGDTPKSISQLIYGTADRSKELKRWNKGGITAGKLIYYASPNQPDDTVMKSFYEERGLQPEQYQVRPGDKMTKIAAKKLGAAGSWKEIAVLNGLAKINAISDGQTLAIYPDLKGGAPIAQAQPTEAPMAQPPANNPYQNQLQQAQANQAMPNAPQGGMPNDPAHPNQPQAQPIGGEAPVAQADPNAQQQPPAQAGEQQPPFMKKRRNEGGVNMGKLLQQNAFFIVMGLGISALLMALLAINKRKKARGEDFNEDGFGATAVKKRR